MSNETNEKQVMTQEQCEAQIRLAAYYLWQAKGEKHGSDVEDWLEAESAFAKSTESVQQ
ncbi:hypothetical protein CR164_08985 [Prosthecochloris marina]|uniref:DUF2934 domain-containing protein n=1 Tax=Prosthecochloris marina TaxID=2017681 RepID=A0A317T434_9CHLB|nr:DUF2934 domain-containing protein [Prosthecochloris marina]PWW81539.1 hypothetical protein CR164_08985 [Prosthecochloris marina]